MWDVSCPSASRMGGDALQTGAGHIFFSDPCVFLLLIGGSFYMLLFVFVSCRVLPIVLRNQCYIMSQWILEAANLALC